MRGARLQRQRILPVRSNVDLDAPVRRGRQSRRMRRSSPVLRRRHCRPPRHGPQERRTPAPHAHRRRPASASISTSTRSAMSSASSRRRRDHRRDRLADEAHDIRRQHRLADRHVVELVQHRLDRLHRREVGSRDDRRAGRCGNPHDPAGGDRAPTKRTQHAAGRSPVNRPWPVTRVGSSTRRIERPTQPPSPSVWTSSTPISVSARTRGADSHRQSHGSRLPTIPPHAAARAAPYRRAETNSRSPARRYRGPTRSSRNRSALGAWTMLS